MSAPEKHAVTGAFGYSGKYIARRLLDRGAKVITLTNSPHRPDPFDGKVAAHPFDFDRPEKLCKTLRGVDVLYNTYWVRFNHKLFAHAEAVENTKVLFTAARDAGVRRIVHVSVTNPSRDSNLEYFRGKAQLEEALKATGISYAILRPAALFGEEDILINNIAWALRRLPVFGVFGSGDYRLQPIYVDDFAELAVNCGAQHEDIVVDAIGPETFTYRELAAAIAAATGKKRLIISVPPALGLVVGTILGKLVGDVMITKDEIEGLMEDLLYVDSPPAGRIRLTDWMREHSGTLGMHYASELARRKDRSRGY